MPELTFAIEGATPVRAAAVPVVGFRVRVGVRGTGPAAVHSILLHCQVRIEPARRRYAPAEQERLRALFGEPERWGRTVRDVLWANVSAAVPPFVGETEIELSVPCDPDLAHAATRYLDALEAGDAPLVFLFRGTVFYEAAGVGTQVGLIPWDREARHRLPIVVWKDLFAGTAP